MLANFLNKSNPINFISLSVFFAICFSATSIIDFLKVEFSFSILFNRILVLLIFIIVFFIFNFIVSKNSLTFDNSYGFFIFSLLCICFAPSIISYKELFLIIIYLLFIRKIYSLQTSKSMIKKLFDSGFWIGILCLLEPSYSLLFVLIYFSAYWNQKITIHTFLTPIIGFFTPIFCYFSYLFWIGKEAVFYEIFTPKTAFKISFFSDENDLIFMVILLILTFFSLISKSSKALLINNTFKKSWSLLLVHLTIVFVLFMIQDKTKNTETIYLLFPVSLVIANGIELIRKRIFINIALYFFLIGCLFYSFYL